MDDNAIHGTISIDWAPPVIRSANHPRHSKASTTYSEDRITLRETEAHTETGATHQMHKDFKRRQLRRLKRDGSLTKQTTDRFGGKQKEYVIGKLAGRKKTSRRTYYQVLWYRNDPLLKYWNN